MNPYLELKKLMVSRLKPITGVVVEVLGSQIKVRTPKGVVDARSTDATVYVAGDEVLLQGTVLQGKVKSESSIPTYQV